MSKITKEQLAEWISVLDTRIQTINDRTKIHTLDIRHLTNRLKRFEKELSENIRSTNLK